MTTALDMIPAIGARVLVRCESLSIECKVTNVKNSWGKPRLLVTPVTGTGEQWVELERVTIPATIHNGRANEHSAERMEPGCNSISWCPECRGWFKPLPRKLAAK